MKCEICNKEVDGLKGLSCHLVKNHKFDKKEYYDKHLKKQNEGKCYFCENESIFFNLTKGYHRICDSKICLGKTRATGTYEFLMYKYNLSEKEAIILMNQRSSERGIKITEGLQKAFKENDKFFKEKSHQSKDFWLKRGFSEEESLNKIKIINDNIHKKTSDKRKNNPELYKGLYPNQLDYWLKKGFTKEESKEKRKERQSTFTLEKCIDRHGEIEGLRIWNDRQEKWSKKIEDKYKNGDFVKFRNDNYSEPELELFENLIERLNLKNNEKVHYGKKQFFRHFKDLDKTFSFDFVYIKKIIEFNGDYWHCNPIKFNRNYWHKYLQMFAYEIWEKEEIKIKAIKNLGYDVLIIWEYDYNNQRELTIQKCIDFLNS
jgi:hypothetical protein